MTDERNGRSDPIVVTRAFDPEEAAYDPDRDEVTFDRSRWASTQRARVQDGLESIESEYDTIPFDRWANTECGRIACNRVEEHVRSELDTEEGISASTPPSDSETTVYLTVATIYNRDGEVEWDAGVSLEEAIAVTPAEVTVTVEVDGRERTRTYSVVVNELRMREE